MTALTDRHRRIIHTAFSILAKGLSPEGLFAEAGLAKASEAPPPPAAAPSFPVVDKDKALPRSDAGLASQRVAAVPKPLRHAQGGLAAEAFFNRLPWPGSQLAPTSSALEPVAPSSREIATGDAPAPLVTKPSPDFAHSPPADSANPEFPVAEALPAELGGPSVVDYFAGLPWSGAIKSPTSLADLDQSPARRDLATGIDSSWLENSGDKAQAAATRIDPSPNSTQSLKIDAEKKDQADHPRAAAAYFSFLPWSSSLPARGNADLGIAPPRRESATEVLLVAYEPRTALPSGSEQAANWPNNPAQSAAEFFQRMAWGAPQRSGLAEAWPGSAIGLGGAMMAAATRSALATATQKDPDAASPEQAAGFFKSLPWGFKPSGQGIQPSN
jgi:hypothetical protein